MKASNRLPPLTLHRRSIAVIGAVGALLLLGWFGWDSLRAARPILRWAWHPATNRVLLTASPGTGPLRMWVWDNTTWALTLRPVSSDPTEVDQLRPGERWSGEVGLRGPDLVERTIRLTVPPLPSFTVRQTTGQEVEIDSSQPLTAVSGIPRNAGSWKAADPSVILLDRAVNPQTVHLDVQARTGERTAWAVPVPALPAVPLVWFGSPSDGQVYLTIDDGWFPSARLLRIMQTRHVPVTAFLIEQAAKEHRAYWQAFVQAGGVIEDHTVSHPYLTSLSFADAQAQWAGPVADYPQWFHIPAPTLGRPPYGAYDGTVEAAAYAAGLKAIVMWDVQWTPGKGFSTWNGGPIQAGDIILLHFLPGVGKAVQALLPQLAKAHLHPSLFTGTP
ncbi:MAG: polysaccharide deacetylase family protein [Thermaerobacter sp.]|nr:polysaccharide deacetylase family protein [Thermaerobacter sp.]